MELRRQHRIVYQSKAFLKAAGRLNDIVVRIQNLSPLGMFVTISGAEVPAAGTEVMCRLSLARQTRTVRGRVAWVREVSRNAPLRSPGAGIEFLDLEKRDVEFLRQLVDPADGERQPVDVWFEGLSAPIRCQASVVGEEVRLATRLPFMRLHSGVRITFLQHPGALAREGTLDSIMLEPSDEQGVPHLRLSISTSVLDNARGTIVNAVPRVAAAKVLSMPTATASTVIDPKLVTTTPSGLFTFGARPDEASAERITSPREVVATNGVSTSALAGWKARAMSARRAGMSWVTGGWRPLVLGCLAGAVVVSLLWSLF